jgi:hypothetical protein
MRNQYIAPGAFLDGPTGPARFLENIILKLKTNERVNKIEENTTAEGEYAVGLYVTDPGIQVEPGATVAPLAVFNSAFLKLRIGSTVIVDRLYLSTIKKWNDQGKAYPLDLPDKIDFSRSTIEVIESAAVVDGQVLQFQVEYLTKRR